MTTQGWAVRILQISRRKLRKASCAKSPWPPNSVQGDREPGFQSRPHHPDIDFTAAA